MIKNPHLLLILLLVPVFPVIAQDKSETMKIEEHITGLDIENHFKQIEEIYTAKSPDMDKIRAFVEQYPVDDFTITNIISTNRNSIEPVTITKNKIQFIEDEKNRYYELIDTRMRHTLTNIKYLDDKLSAEVSYTSLFQGRIKEYLKGKGLSYMDFKSLAICTDILKLVNGSIKGYRAECRIDIIYGDPVSAN